MPRTSASSRPVIAWLVAGALAILAALLLGRILAAGGSLATADRDLLQAVNARSTPAALVLAEVIAHVFGPPISFGIALLVVLLIGAVRRSVGDSVRAAVVLGIPWGIAHLLKYPVGRPRPLGDWLGHHPLPSPGSPSFPSGHTAFAAALCMCIVLSIRPGIRRRFAVVAALLVVATVAWSRVALGAHFPGDVLTSAALVPVLALATARVADRVAALRSPAAPPGSALPR